MATARTITRTTGGRGNSPLPYEARAVKRRIEAWRATRRKGRAMPEELWQAAARLAQKHGLTVIARGMPVEYAPLKRRVAALQAERDENAVSSANFVEIDTTAVLGAPTSSGALVELARPDGARMTIHLPGGASLDVAVLAAAFCGGAS